MYHAAAIRCPVARIAGASFSLRVVGKTGGSRPARRLTFVQANKSKQKWLPLRGAFLSRRFGGSFSDVCQILRSALRDEGLASELWLRCEPARHGRPFGKVMWSEKPIKQKLNTDTAPGLVFLFSRVGYLRSRACREITRAVSGRCGPRVCRYLLGSMWSVPEIGRWRFPVPWSGLRRRPCGCGPIPGAGPRR